MTDSPPRILGTIDVEEVYIGKGAVIDEGVLITGKGGKCERVDFGDFCHIGKNTTVMAPELIIGDYTNLNEHALCHGVKPLRFGRNCWFGGHGILDCMGGLDICDNVGVGAGSQLWTHALLGDIVESLRFYFHKHMTVGKDAWLVGHCLVSPVSFGDRSVAMLGSLVTSDMAPNHICDGSPAKDLTDKLGTRFEERSVDEKVAAARKMILRFESKHPEHRDRILAVDKVPSREDSDVTYLDLSKRTYARCYSVAEVTFFITNGPLIKLTPEGEPPQF